MSQLEIFDVLGNITFSQIKCNTCKAKIDIVESDLVSLWNVYNTHKAEDVHLLAVSELSSKAGVSQLAGTSSSGKSIKGPNIPPAPVSLNRQIESEKIFHFGEQKNEKPEKVFHFGEHSDDLAVCKAPLPKEGIVNGLSKLKLLEVVSDLPIVEKSKTASQEEFNPIVKASKAGGKDNGVWQCKICQVYFTEDQVEFHKKSEKHKKLLKEFQASPVITQVKSTTVASPPPVLSTNVDIWCDACNKAINSCQFSSHAGGKKHLQNMQKKGMVVTAPSTASTQQVGQKLSQSQPQEEKLNKNGSSSLISVTSCSPNQEAENQKTDAMRTWCEVCSTWLPYAPDDYRIHGHRGESEHQRLALQKGNSNKKISGSPKCGEAKKRGAALSWCEVCADYLPYPPEDRRVNEHKNLHQNIANKQNGNAPNQNPNTACGICKIPVKCLTMHGMIQDHIDLLRKKEEQENDFLRDEYDKNLMWCHICLTWLPKINNFSHYQTPIHKECEKKVFAHSRHIFEYKHFMSKGDDPVFSCVLCFAFGGKNLLNESDVEMHCSTPFHQELVKAEVRFQQTQGRMMKLDKSTLSDPLWECQLCWEVSPVSTSVSKHVETDGHREAVTRHNSHNETLSAASAVSHPLKLEHATVVKNDQQKRSNLKFNEVEAFAVSSFSELQDTRPTTDSCAAVSFKAKEDLSEEVYCMMCSMVCTKQEEKKHYKSLQHLEKVEKLHRLNLLKTGNIPAGKVMEVMQEMVKVAEGVGYGEGWWPKLEVVPTGIIVCRLCDKTFSGAYDAVVHVLWRNHQGKIRALRSNHVGDQFVATNRLSWIKKGELRCDVCEEDVGSLGLARDHIKRPMHSQLLAIEGLSHKDASAVVMSAVKMVGGDRYESDDLFDCEDFFYCNLCDEALPSPGEAIKHVHSIVHKVEVTEPNC